MSKEKRRVPKLRFPGFTEDWEQRKLGDFTNQINTFVNPEDAKLPLWSLTAEAGLIEKSDRYERDFLVKKKDQFKRIETNTLVYNPMNITIGSIDIYTGLYPIAVSGYYVSIVYDKNIDTDFLKEVLLLPSSLKMYKNYATGSLIERQRVQYPTFSKLQLLLPNLDEQKAIGQIFKSLNLNITLHQRKLEHLNLKKKALLQKLFPKNGECYPELRFPGFTDAWEQRKLCQITTRVTRKNGGQSDLPLTISAQDGLVDQRKYFNRQVASRDMSNYYLIKKGEFAYNKSYSEGYPFGAVKRLDYYDIGALSTLYILFEITDNNISSDFIVSYYMTHLWYKEISKRAAEGARNHGLLNISTEDFFDSDLNIPNSIEEQVKIGNFIKQLDKFITLHQRKLDHLQLQKKALLQQMFV